VHLVLSMLHVLKHLNIESLSRMREEPQAHNNYDVSENVQ